MTVARDDEQIVRVEGVGVAARRWMLALAPMCAIIGAFMLVDAVDGGGPASAVLLAAALVLGSTASTVRAFQIGLWISPRRIVVRSWWRTYSYPLRRVRHVMTAPYSGFFKSRIHESYRLSILVLALLTDRYVELDVTMAHYKESRRQAKAITRIIEDIKAGGGPGDAVRARPGMVSRRPHGGGHTRDH